MRAYCIGLLGQNDRKGIPSQRRKLHMTLNKSLLTASIFFFAFSGASFAQELVSTSNQMIAKLERNQPIVCRQVPATEKAACEQMFAETIQAIRTKVARFTQGDQKGFDDWKNIEKLRISELFRRYGHIQVPTGIGAPLAK